MNKFFYIIFVFFFCQLVVAPLEAAKHNKTSQSVASQEMTLHHLINQERQKYGLPPLIVWDALSRQAQQHSMKMANGEVEFGHTGFEGRAKAIQKEAKCYSVGENVAYTLNVSDPLPYAVEMWMESPGHRENILGDYCESGIGIVYNKAGYCYITQLFSKRVR
jgi:uncharacterized protein YkwD